MSRNTRSVPDLTNPIVYTYRRELCQFSISAAEGWYPEMADLSRTFWEHSSVGHGQLPQTSHHHRHSKYYNSTSLIPVHTQWVQWWYTGRILDSGHIT